MTISGEVGGDDPLYLDDLQVGQRFISKTHVVDAAQIKAFARQFDPQPFHLDDDAAKDSLFSGLVGDPAQKPILDALRRKTGCSKIARRRGRTWCN
jgi:acyl dehydratase